MADLPHVIQGQGGWVLPFNKIIDFYNAVGGGTVNHLSSPLSFSNGASATSNDIYYIDAANGYRRVFLSVMKLKATDFKVGDQLWQFPDGFKPIDGATVPVNQTAAAIVWTGGDAHLFDGDKAWGTTTTIGEAYVGYSYFAKITEN